MTTFEQYLLDNGYIRFVLNTKTMKYEQNKEYRLSSLYNLDHRYIHKDNKVFLDKINANLSVTSKDFTWEHRKNEICFGLHEQHKPPTLISPRPRIEVKRIIDSVIVYRNELFDDDMNVILKHYTSKEVLEAMYNKNIVLKVDLTKE